MSVKKSKFRLFAMLSAICLTAGILFSPITSIAEESEEDKAPSAPQGEVVFADQYGATRELVAENDRYQLYIEKEYYIMAIVEKDTGKVWYSSPPEAQEMKDQLSGAGRQQAAAHLHVGYLNTVGRTNGVVNSQLGSVRQKTATITKIDGGIRILFDFSRETDRFKIPVEYTLNEDGLTARIIYEDIEEYGDVIITTIALLPYFNCTSNEESGYLFVPDGSGAIIPFGSGKASTKAWSQAVYGRDAAYSLVKTSIPSENVYLPVFGHYGTDHSSLAVIDEGAGMATMTAMPSGSASPFNYCYATFTYRGVDSAVLSDASWISKTVSLFTKSTSSAKSVGVRYYFVGEADLVDLADTYRAHLKDSGSLGESGVGENSLYVELYGGIKKKKSYFGLILETVQPMTTFSQAEELLAILKKQGVENMTVKYNGVRSGGMNGSPVLDSNLESALGGNGAFESLAKYAASNGINLYADFEFQKIYQDSFLWWSFTYAAKTVSQAPAIQFEYRQSTLFRNLNKKTYYLLSPKKLTEEVSTFMDRINLPESVGVGTGSIGNYIFSDFDNGDYYDRARGAQIAAQNLQAISDKGRKVLVSGGFDFAVDAADAIFGIPMTDSMFDVTEMDVPFYAMVFHGYKLMGGESINLSEDPQTMFLKCMEQGVCPTVTLTWEDAVKAQDTDYNFLLGTNYERWLEESARYYKEFTQAMGDTVGQPIESYQIINEDVRRTQFADGKVIYVNYGETAYEGDGISVEPLSYIVQKG